MLFNRIMPHHLPLMGDLLPQFLFLLVFRYDLFCLLWARWLNCAGRLVFLNNILFDLLRLNTVDCVLLVNAFGRLLVETIFLLF